MMQLSGLHLTFAAEQSASWINRYDYGKSVSSWTAVYKEYDKQRNSSDCYVGQLLLVPTN